MDAIVVNLYRNNSSRNVINKVLDFVRIFRGTFREPFDITAPVITLSYNSPPDFNYVDIPSLNRKYFVSGYSNIANSLWEIYLEVDVLESYKNSVLSLDAIIERNEFNFDDRIIDSMQVFEQGYNVTRSYGTQLVGGGVFPDYDGTNPTIDDYTKRYLIISPFFELEPVGSG